MALQDIIQKHFTPAEQAAINTKMDELEALFVGKLQNLTEEENGRYGSIDEKNKLFANKAYDYNNNQPTLSSGDVDWVEYGKDYFDRSVLQGVALRLDGLSKSCMETKRLHDFDNYQNALIDKKYTDYKSETGGGVLYDTKAAEYKQFFT